MSFVKGVCRQGKALAEVAVGAVGGKKRLRATALIDTGATMTGVAENIVQALELQWLGKRERIKLAVGEAEAASYRASVFFLSGGGVIPAAHEIKILSIPARRREYDILLGTDILAKCCFVLRGDEFFLGFDGGDKTTLNAAAGFLSPRAAESA